MEIFAPDKYRAVEWFASGVEGDKFRQVSGGGGGGCCVEKVERVLNVWVEENADSCTIMSVRRERRENERHIPVRIGRRARRREITEGIVDGICLEEGDVGSREFDTSVRGAYVASHMVGKAGLPNIDFGLTCGSDSTKPTAEMEYGHANWK